MIKTKPTSKLKTISMIVKNTWQKKIFNEMTGYSKNIFNITIYCYNVLKYFENDIYRDLLELFIKDKHINIDDNFYALYNKYYKLYSDNFKLRKENNEIIYKYIKDNLKDFVKNSNIDEIKNRFKSELNKLVNHNENNKNFVFYDLIEKIINSYYNKNYFYTENCLLNHIPIDKHKENDFIDDVRNERYIIQHTKNTFKNRLLEEFEIINNTTFKIISDEITKNFIPLIDVNKTEKELIKINKKTLNGLISKAKKEFKPLLKLKTEQNMVGRIVYKNLGDNENKLPADIIINIIKKTYECISSYYGLKNAGIKCNKVNFLDKNGNYILSYYARSFRQIKRKVKLTLGDNIRNKYLDFTNNANLKRLNNHELLQKYNNMYYNISNLVLTKTLTKEKNNKEYIKVDNEHSIKKEYLFDPNFMNIIIPKKLSKYKIKYIEIILTYKDNFKIAFIYDETEKFEDFDKLKKINKIQQIMKEKQRICTESIQSINKCKSLTEIEIDLSVSIDFGMINLMAIYDPTGEQRILKGGYLISVNEKYNKLIKQEQSELNKKKLYMSDKLASLFIQRDREIEK